MACHLSQCTPEDAGKFFASLQRKAWYCKKNRGAVNNFGRDRNGALQLYREHQMLPDTGSGRYAIRQVPL